MIFISRVSGFGLSLMHCGLSLGLENIFRPGTRRVVTYWHASSSPLSGVAAISSGVSSGSISVLNAPPLWKPCFTIYYRSSSFHAT